MRLPQMEAGVGNVHSFAIAVHRPAVSMKKVFLASKLTPPTVSRYSVDRTEICNQVFLSFGAKVILIRGPAGFGKTTVMAQLLERYRKEGTAVAWVNLDEADNDLPRFLSCMLVAIKNQLQPESTLQADDADVSSDAGQLTLELAKRLGQSNVPFALFLDEVEVISDPAVLAFIKQLIARLPANSRLVLGSRCVPDIGLGRLRAHAELLEVVPEQLRFSDDEAKLFLTQRRGLKLKPEQVQSLLRSTEGWPTALWLASVALERRTNAEEFIAGFAGSSAAITEYLADDVMAGQPAEIREFLLKTSILSQFDAALCDAVCGRSDSAELLERLERSNLFLSLVDERQGLYRYHSLFRGFLQSQLSRRYGNSLPSLHRAAADWFLAQGRPIPAIDHALEAGDLALAIPLLEQHAESLLNEGRLRLLTRWLETYPATVEDSPRLRLFHIWAVNLTRGPQEALALIEQIDPVDLGEGAVLAQFHAMHPTLLGMRDRIDESFALGIDRLQVVKPEHGFPYAILSQTLANDSMILGQYAEARRYADQARTARTGNTSALQMSLAGAVNGAIDLIQGRLRQALAELRLASGITDEDVIQNGNRNLLPGVILAEALYEAGQYDRAERLLNLFMPLAQSLGLSDQLIIAHSVLARIVERQHDPSRVFGILAQLESLGHKLGLNRVVASARIEKSSALLMRGDTVGAKEQLLQAGDDRYWQEISSRSYIANDKITLVIGRLRWMISSGEAAQALALIKQPLTEAAAAQRNRRALKLRILMAEALYVDGQRNVAMRTLGRALELGALEGFVGSFLEEGPRIHEMLRELLRARQNDADYRDEDPLSIHLIKLAGTQQEAAPAKLLTSGPAEALTRKELQILELLSQGHSNDSMADKLFVSESTVRTHLRSINTKLHASNRMHALAIARRMQLIA
jgi:LuxR family maltose regulon positive regulatory protein